jgi:hypothetical protein
MLRTRAYLLTLILPIGAYLTAGGFVPCAFGQDSDDPRSDLLAKWRGQQAEIITATCSVRSYRYAPQTRGKISRDELSKTLALFQDRGFEDAIKALSSQLPGLSPPYKGLMWGVPVLIQQEGSKVRNTYMPNANQDQGWAFTNVFDGNLQLEYQRVKQITIMPALEHAMIDVREIRFWPFVVSERVQPTKFGLIRRSETSVELKSDSVELVADRQTGQISRVTVTAPQKSGRVMVEEALRCNYKKYPGDVVFPTTVVNATYADNVLTLIEVYLVESASFNHELPINAFVLDAPAKTTIVDVRVDRARPLISVTSQPVENVIQFADQQRRSVLEEGKPPTRSGLLWTGIGLGLVLTLLGIASWRRAACRVIIR